MKIGYWNDLKLGTIGLLSTIDFVYGHHFKWTGNDRGIEPLLYYGPLLVYFQGSTGIQTPEQPHFSDVYKYS